MFRKYTLLLGLVLTVALVSTGYGQTIIGDWENSMDGWMLWGEAPVGTTTSYSTTGATLNDTSLKLDVTEGDWHLVLTTKLQEQGFVDDFYANDILSMDLTRIAAEWIGIEPTDGWSGLGMVVNAGGDGWQIWHDLGHADNGWWDYNWGDDTRTVSWDYTGAFPSMDPNNTWWLEFVMYTNFDPNFAYPDGGTYYFDNAQLNPIPEPTTLAMLASLLGLICLALLRRKRAC